MPRSRHDSGEGGIRWSGLLGSILALVLGCTAALAAAGLVGRGPLRDLGWSEQRMQPQVVRWDGDRDSVRVIDVGFALTDRQDCVGDFTVQVSESAEAVLVGAVVGRVPRLQVVDPACTSQVPSSGRVFATVDLATPLGGRDVIRASDRQPLRRSPQAP